MRKNYIKKKKGSLLRKTGRKKHKSANYKGIKKYYGE
jgi:hypothetical protein